MLNLDWHHIKQLLSPRIRDSHKGDYGHALIVGGDHGMGGAVRMAAEAALRVGAGLVSVATRTEHVTIVSGPRPELMCHAVNSPSDLDALISRATLLVMGPGLGKSDWSRALFNKLLEVPLPKIIDADGLNLLAEKTLYDHQWLLTPHMGEAARLLKLTVSEIQKDRLGAINQLHERWGGVIVLKGMNTLIQSQAEVMKCTAGNPGMASGGMGDILSGVIGGLAAQKLSLFEAAQAGVLIHSLAGDQAALAKGERGLLATDLLPYIHQLVNPI